MIFMNSCTHQVDGIDDTLVAGQVDRSDNAGS